MHQTYLPITALGKTPVTGVKPVPDATAER